MKALFVVLFAILLLSFKPNLVMALDVPNFPACTNPNGTLIVSYDSGVHGVVGGLSYTGSDKVYRLDDVSLVQCLCTSDGRGIQTNWWKASSLDEAQISILKSQGWIYIPTGTVWGLTQDAYLAKNVDYLCASNNGGAGTNSSSSNSSSIVGQVLGLAFTGNIAVVYVIFILGFLSLIYGQILHRSRS